MLKKGNCGVLVGKYSLILFFALLLGGWNLLSKKTEAAVIEDDVKELNPIDEVDNYSPIDSLSEVKEDADRVDSVKMVKKNNVILVDSVSMIEKSGISVDSSANLVNKYVLTDSLYIEKIKLLANNDTSGLWPVLTQPNPLPGSILPDKRIVAYYGNMYSKRMGVLGKYPPKEMWKRLNAEIAKWEKADSLTPVLPAVHYIAVVAQGDSMRDGKYRMRMPHSQIDSALTIARMGKAIVFLDIQPGLSDVESEVPRLEEYLKLPEVHLGLDPEFYMQDGQKPGIVKGYATAKDINFCTQYLADLVKKYNIPPKVFVVHRFSRKMIRNYKDIKLHPEVQIVVHMDGWGSPYLKRSTYRDFIYKEPVQFTGFKLFYVNDTIKPSTRMMEPSEILKLQPKPVYIQYQ